MQMNGQIVSSAPKENTKYAYAVGRIRALEVKLLNKTSVNRLLEADSVQEVLKMLSEGEYGDSMSGIQNAEDFETALNMERERIYKLIDMLSLDPELTSIFRIRWDFHNLKVLLKSSYLEGPVREDALVISGLFPIESMQSVVESKETSVGYSLIGQIHIINALKEAMAQFEENQNPQMIDIIIDKHAHNFVYQKAEDYPNSFLCGYFGAVADLTNIKSFIRLKALKENVRTLDAVLFSYGSIEKSLFLRQFDEPLESFAERLAHTPYRELVDEGIRRWLEQRSMAAYERLADDYLINFIKPAKYVIFGVEPLIGYLLAKEHEMKIIRIIIIGKLNELPTDAIKERLRETYV
jgi:V/A-type H+-transporting ATPase subunit C